MAVGAIGEWADFGAEVTATLAVTSGQILPAECSGQQSATTSSQIFSTGITPAVVADLTHIGAKSY